MTLGAGARLGPYEIIALLGTGGMGEVYRARDSRLNRDVAIKILPSSFAANRNRMLRFEREAQVLAALNHPNIAMIFGIEEGALVMELVEGTTLAERIAVGPIPLDEALGVARQVADALESAHEKGIVHRDLKPANIKINPEGVVKVLDFGLAKALGDHAIERDHADSPTLTMESTLVGMVLGTPAYMSPEQARGKPVDKRADIWSFGVVFDEMLTGRRLFDGEGSASTIASVLHQEPDWSMLPPDTPVHIRRLLVRCLCKDPKKRLRDIGDARLTMEEPGGQEQETAKTDTRRVAIPWAIASLLAAMAIIGWWRVAEPSHNSGLIRLDLVLPAEVSVGRSTNGALMALSPDGTRLAIVLKGVDGKIQLYTRLIHRHEVTLLAGTEGASGPFFSPDGQWIGFFADGKLKKISVEGGNALVLCDAPGARGASWGDDGNIIAALGLNDGLSRVSSSGGTPVPVTKLAGNEKAHRWPQVLPGSQTVLFTAVNGSAWGAILTYDDANIDVVTLQTGSRKTIQHGGFSGRYLPSKHLVYINQSTLFAAPFDLAQLTLKHTPLAVV
jgi:Protein kinase domain/WD40-like Beta Propeller Repeat